MDLQTAKDYIEDLMLQRDALNAQVGELEDHIRQLKAELEHATANATRYAADYFHWRQTAEKLIANLQAVEAERDQWQRQAVQHG